MTKIAVFVVPSEPLTQTFAVLRRAEPAISLRDFRARIAAGVPALEYTLYENDHVDVAQKLRLLMRHVPQTGSSLRLLLLHDLESIDSIDTAKRTIPSSTLANMLDGAEGDYE